MSAKKVRNSFLIWALIIIMPILVLSAAKSIRCALESGNTLAAVFVVIGSVLLLVTVLLPVLFDEILMGHNLLGFRILTIIWMLWFFLFLVVSDP
jgi:hypothetical protein